LQYDAFEIGFITTDDFTNGDILEATYPAVAKRLYDDWMHDPAVPIVTGFLGKVFQTVYNLQIIKIFIHVSVACLIISFTNRVGKLVRLLPWVGVAVI